MPGGLFAFVTEQPVASCFALDWSSKRKRGSEYLCLRGGDASFSGCQADRPLRFLSTYFLQSRSFATAYHVRLQNACGCG